MKDFALAILPSSLFDEAVISDDRQNAEQKNDRQREDERAG